MNNIISIKEYFLDLFSSFYFDKSKIHEQLLRDFHRMSVYMNGNRVHKLDDFYRIINNLPISRIYKRMIWIIPTQVSMVYFYTYILKYYQDIKSTYAVAELSDNTKYSNEFIVNIDIIDNKYICIKLNKNFRILDTCNSNIPTVSYILLAVDINIGKTKNLNYEWKEIFIK